MYCSGRRQVSQDRLSWIGVSTNPDGFGRCVTGVNGCEWHLYFSAWSGRLSVKITPVVVYMGLSCRSVCLIHIGTCIRVSRVGRVSRVRVTLIVTVRVNRVSVMVSVRDSVK